MKKIVSVLPALAVMLVLLIIIVTDRRANQQIPGIASVTGCRMRLPPGITSDRPADATLVVYYDTITCISCMMKRLSEWNGLFSETAKTGSFRTLFIFEPPKDDRTVFMEKIDHADLRYPVFFDDYRIFRRLNPNIAANSRLRAFLLDRKRNIVLSGDPNHNIILKEVFMMYINALLENDGILPDGFAENVKEHVRTRTHPECGLVFDTFQTDVKNAETGYPLTVTFNAVNNTEATVEIAEIITDCDCVEATASTHVTVPGKTSVITVSFAPENRGRFEHHVFIRTTSSPKEIDLIVTGNAI